KRVPANTPEWVRTTEVSTPNGTKSDALVVQDMAHIVWAVNLGCLGFHVWPFHADHPEYADELRVDLDPSPGTGYREVKQAARLAGDPRQREHLRIPGPAHLHPAAAAVGLLPGSFGRRCARAHAGEATPRSDHCAVVEGRARSTRLRGLQPERAAQDGLRRVVC